MAADEVLLERRDGVTTVTLNRPQAFNALNAAVLARLREIVQHEADRGTRAIIVTGSGAKAFSAGADLGELDGLSAVDAHAVLAEGQRTMQVISESPVPVIAAVNGLALGGGFELILSCTFPVLSMNAALALPESGLGLIPGYGGTQRLPLAIGRAAAAHLMLTGERLSAQRAYELGLTPVLPVPQEDLIEAVGDIARTIAAKGPRAQAAILQALRTAGAPATGLHIETALAGIATGSAEAAEGIAAFREKRQAHFPTNGTDAP